MTGGASLFHWRAYFGFVSGTFRKMLAYRLRYVTGIVSYLVYVTTYYFLWRAVFSTRGEGATVGGQTFAELVTYVAVSWIGRSFYFNNVDRELGEQVQNGTIAVMLARPLSVHATVVANSLGEAAFRFLFFTLLIGSVIFLIFPVAAPASPWHAVAFVVSLVFSNVILTHVNFLVGMAAFPLKNIDGVMRAKHYLIEILSGLLLPVTMFPAWLQSVSEWLPFRSVAWIPSSIWIGKLAGGSLAYALLEQACWVAFLALLCAFVWRKAARRLTLQGG